MKALMPDPRQMVDVETAAGRLVQAVGNREKVGIFGDYDVDGACSSALMAGYLRA